MKKFQFGQDYLKPAAALAIARRQLSAEIPSATIEAVIASRSAVDEIVDRGKIVYGINTGFGSLCNKIISAGQTRQLQENILRSHSVGVGPDTSNEVVRLMLITKIHALAKGFSGISLEVLERLHWHLQQDILPHVPQQGSLGASGDLAPLAHLCLPLVGLGKVWYKNQWVATAEMMQGEGIEPLALGAKEGLALINGTQFILANAVRGWNRMRNCLDTADIVGAMTLEGLLGSSSPFNPDLHSLRPYKGSQYVAHRMRLLLKDSEMVASHANCGRVQDPYSLRCIPQVHGASRNSWLHLNEILEVELNSVTDNPVIFSANKTISGGNFHGQPMALPLDYATLASAELGNISDRRIYLLLEGGVDGLPELLMRDTGINSGFMIPQYTSAALVSENKSLCFPPSADSIPSSLGQEDHVSMGSISSRRLNQVLDNLENVLSIELLCAAQAFDYRRPMRSSRLLDACHELVRSRIDHAEEDRVFADDIQVLHKIVSEQELQQLTEKIAQDEQYNLYGSWEQDFRVSF
jgi:histidine ammonia-lyase